MNTIFMLMAQHGGAAMIPAEVACKEYFEPLTLNVFYRKIGAGEIDLPLVRMEKSQKAPKYIHLSDLAAYIDSRRESAQKEARQLRAV